MSSSEHIERAFESTLYMFGRTHAISFILFAVKLKAGQLRSRAQAAA
jgi:hypothetical protein